MKRSRPIQSGSRGSWRISFWNRRYAAGARLIAVPGWPLPTFSTASAARTRTVSTAFTSRSVQPTVSARGAFAFTAPHPHPRLWPGDVSDDRAANSGLRRSASHLLGGRRTLLFEPIAHVRGAAGRDQDRPPARTHLCTLATDLTRRAV